MLASHLTSKIVMEHSHIHMLVEGRNEMFYMYQTASNNIYQDFTSTSNKISNKVISSDHIFQIHKKVILCLSTNMIFQTMNSTSACTKIFNKVMSSDHISQMHKKDRSTVGWYERIFQTMNSTLVGTKISNKVISSIHNFKYKEKKKKRIE